MLYSNRLNYLYINKHPAGEHFPLLHMRTILNMVVSQQIASHVCIPTHARKIYTEIEMIQGSISQKTYMSCFQGCHKPQSHHHPSSYTPKPLQNKQLYV